MRVLFASKKSCKPSLTKIFNLDSPRMIKIIIFICVKNRYKLQELNKSLRQERQERQEIENIRIFF